MRVCHLVHHLANGGLEQQIYQLVRHSSDDLEHTVCYLGEDNSLEPELTAAGASVVDIDKGKTGPRGVFDPRTPLAVLSLLRDQEFDILHVHTPLYVHVVGRLAAAATRTPVVGTYHNQQQNFHPVMQALERVTRPLSSVNVGVSKAVERSFTGSATEYGADDANRGRSCTIYNGIDVEAFRNSVSEVDTTPLKNKYDLDDKLVFLNVGRYTPQKGQRDLVRAMDIVVNEIPEARLFIVGWGQLEERLKQEVQDRGLEEYVFVTGKVPTVAEYYGLADVFVLSSHREGLPIVILEAMSAYLPIVSTRVSGVPEAVIAGKSGQLVPPGSYKKLSEAMLAFQSSDRREQFGANGFQTVRERFDIENTAES